MSIIHMQRITSAIWKLFDGRIDLSDIQSKPAQQREEAFLSRGLAAYTLTVVADVDPTIAADALTDGYDDNGIDAVYFDRSNSVLYVVQSKWSGSGNGSIDQGHSKKLIAGFHDLVNLRLDRFNDRLRKRESELREALYNSDVGFVIVLSHTGVNPPSKHVKSDFDALMEEMNSPDEVVSYQVFDQKRIYDAVAGHAQRHSINLEIMLHEWGLVEGPYRAYYGQVDVGSIADWWSSHGRALFVRNIRNFRGSTDVNDSLMTTLKREPQHFWYFNNGITILCTKVSKKPLGGSSRDSGVFECDGVSIVNGAQTVGIIGSSAKALQKLEHAPRVLVRLISLENCPEGFDKQVTRATNTQNRIERRDFAALDPNQHRLASEFLLDNKRYAYKSGDEEPPPGEGCSIVDATVALACAHEDMGLAVTAKREVGRLWESIEAPPYTTLFNDRTNALEVWRAVEIMRAVEESLKDLAGTHPPRGDMVAVHGNRLTLHCVFMDPMIRGFRAENVKFDDMKAAARRAANDVFGAMVGDVETHYPNSYLATLFKNQKKCRDIADRLLHELYGRTSNRVPPEPKSDDEGQGTLFYTR